MIGPTREHQFESDVFISRKHNRINAKSIMGVMMLAASKGVELELEVDGGDEQACHQALVELIGNRFGEDE